MAGCLNVSNITYHFAKNPLFSPLSFQLSGGEGLCLKGDNGSGKSTALKILAGLLSPDTGDIEWQTKKIGSNYRNALAYLGHEHGLKTELTVEENWKMHLAIHQSPARTDTLKTLDTFELPENTIVSELSKGQQRKAAIAKLSLLKKTIWILDEPFSNLDLRGQNQLLAMMNQHLENSGLLLFSAHGNQNYLSRDLQTVVLC